jgi:hypothetical protein
MAKPPSPPFERFIKKVQEQSNGCWHWTGYISGRGYGSFGRGRRYEGQARAHVWSYEYHKGPVPKGYHVDHVCHGRDQSCAGGPKCLHRRCVNPEHLAAVTPQENFDRAGIRGRLHVTCLRGHDLSGENVVYAGGRRTCRICKNERNRRYRERVRTNYDQ